jgi:hypothetical protein
MISKRNNNIVRLENLNLESKNMIKTWLTKSKFMNKNHKNELFHSKNLQRTRLHTYPRFDTILKIIQDQEKRIALLEKELLKIKSTNSHDKPCKKHKPNYKINPLFDKNVIPEGGIEFLEAYIGQSPTNHL